MIRKSVILLMVLSFVFCTHSLAYSSDDVEWASSIDSRVLHWGDSVKDDEYTVKVMDFSEDGFVHVQILKDGDIKEQGALHVGGSLIYDDEINVFAKKVTVSIDDWTGNMEDPTAELQIYRRGLPEFEITIEPEKETYDPRIISTPSTIVTTITVKNVGAAKAEDIDLIIDTGGLELVDGKLKHHFMSLEKSESSEPVTVEMDVPLLWDEKDFDISVKAKGYDIKGNLYEDEGSESVKIEEKWGLEVTKAITEDVYMSDTAYALVTVRNFGLCNLNSIKVSDSVIEGFELKDSVTLEKTISLKRGESTRELFEYSLKPIKTGEFTSPAATAEFTAANGKTYTVSSNQPKAKVEGPDILVTKRVSSTNVEPGDEITVTVDVENRGNVKVSVKAWDTLPDYADFVSGDLDYHEVLDKGKKQSFSYVMKINEVGDFKLPQVNATFIDMEHFKGERISNMPMISVALPPEDRDAVESQTQATTSTGGGLVDGVSDVVSYGSDEEGVAPGFGSMLTGALLIFACVLLRRKS